MKELDVKFIEQLEAGTNYQRVAESMKKLPWHALDQAPWTATYPYRPEVRFQVGYSQQFMVLHYDVVEEFLRANAVLPNESVWEDSCVEFFVSFDQGKHYYNLEFNILGTGLIGFGSAVKSQRGRLSAEQIQTVCSFTQIQRHNGVSRWQIVLLVPLSLFGKSYSELRGTAARANFYKCGDGLPQPHFVCWNAIENSEPNFHLPRYFGTIRFEN